MCTFHMKGINIVCFLFLLYFVWLLSKYCIYITRLDSIYINGTYSLSYTIRVLQIYNKHSLSEYCLCCMLNMTTKTFAAFVSFYMRIPELVASYMCAIMFAPLYHDVSNSSDPFLYIL